MGKCKKCVGGIPFMLRERSFASVRIYYYMKISWKSMIDFQLISYAPDCF